MTGDVSKVPVTHDEIMYTRLTCHTRARWTAVYKQNPHVARGHRRKAIDDWYRSCEVMLQFGCPHFYDADGKPLL